MRVGCVCACVCACVCVCIYTNDICMHAFMSACTSGACMYVCTVIRTCIRTYARTCVHCNNLPLFLILPRISSYHSFLVRSPSVSVLLDCWGCEGKPLSLSSFLPSGKGSVRSSPAHRAPRTSCVGLSGRLLYVPVQLQGECLVSFPPSRWLPPYRKTTSRLVQAMQ